MHCTSPLPELLLASVKNAKAFSHAELKLSLLNNKRMVTGWRFYVQLHTRFKFEHAICALATVERDSLASSSSSESQIGSDLNFGASRDVSEEDPDLDEREKLRRSRISRANKGNVPWNKGKKHSPETRERIRERTKIAMQNPKVKMKLLNLGHAQSVETKAKIGEGVREGWKRRREKLMIQDGCRLEWRNMIAEAARVGFYGEVEHHWDSYEVLLEELKQEYAQSVERRKLMRRLHGSRRAPKSLEQRKKLSDTLRAKWADPDYRERVHTGMIRHYSSAADSEKKQKKKPARTSSSNGKISTLSEVKSETKSVIVPKRTKKDGQPYKDPMVGIKLDMIKKIKDQRLARESKKNEAVQRARLLIVEAEKAASALEVAALKNPLALESLVEARNLISKATQMLDSIEQGLVPANSSLNNISLPDSDTDDQVPTSLHINGKSMFNLDESALSLALNGSEKAINGRCLSVNGSGEGEKFSREEEEDEKNEELEPSRKVKMKWISGRLVEVEGD